MEIDMDQDVLPADRIAQLKRSMRAAVCGFRFDEGESLYLELTEQCGVDPDSDDMLPSRVMMGIFAGRLRDMLHMLNDLGEDRAIGLKVVCLHLLDDPLWEGMALQAVQTSPDDNLRHSMQALLDAREG